MKHRMRIIGLLSALSVFAPLLTAFGSIRYHLPEKSFQNQLQTDPDNPFGGSGLSIDVRLVGGTIDLNFSESDIAFGKRVTNADIIDYSITVQVGTNTYSWTKANNGPDNILSDEGVALEATPLALRFLPVPINDPDYPNAVSSLRFLWNDNPESATEDPTFRYIAGFGERSYELFGVQPRPFSLSYGESYEDFSPPNVWNIGFRNVGVVPEPASMAVWAGVAIVGAAGATRRRRQARTSIA